jgi:phosphate transport system ATP-binding protein
MENPVFRSQAFNVRYGSVHAVNDVTLMIPQGRITALIGASGSGKSTFIRGMNRMLDHLPNARIEGRMEFQGRDIYGGDMNVVELRERVGMVFQSPTPFPKSIYDNVAYGLEIQGKAKKTWWWNRRKPTAARLEHSDDPLDQAVMRSLKEASLWGEVKDRLHHSAYRLSGGQQQRLCIARAIAVRPDVLLLDEPCSALDPISTRHIEELLLALKDNYTIVIVTHNMHQARRIADYVGFFHAGKLVEFDETAKIFEASSQQLTREYVQGAFG